MLMVSELLELARGTPPKIVPPGGAGQGRYVTGLGPVVVWNVCKHCNMHCPHCYAAAITRPDDQDLGFEEGCHLLDDLRTIDAMAVIFSGGEPMLRRDILPLIRYAKKIGHRPQLSSNGVMITHEVARDLAAAGVEYVGISIDGTQEFNDRYRGMEQGYERAFRGADASLAAGMKVGIRMTVSRQNSGQIHELLDEVVRRRIQRFYVSHLVYSGRARDDHSYDLSVTENRALVEELFTRADRLLDEGAVTRVVTGGNDVDGPFLYFYVLKRYGELAARRVLKRLEARGGNSAGEKVINIDNRGNVHPDQFWTDARLGNVRHTPIAEILRHPLVGELRSRVERLEGKCRECAFKAACRGSHRERALASGGGLWSPDPSCYLTDAEIRRETVCEATA
ncbi:MAG: radical SAM protein [Deltaproteobacteria bacterium]|nr:radical SAM protein [Deltaproteobacteria bacterium]